ncbi:TonB-dependent receptor plug domain-containing protein [Thauera linaloolentis]|uniref:TonB-dependent receptor n=1 Tax=Thauera linaloolentis (strain DSM 12138 / JCM 21573 / CCUG 41526 / CIP 105981 / IAM 15112 / NBRC 102519 / 47Lol) TaxID=1123367 RepID=N6Z4U6_THAL4|nr:TonB-dependent receptor [Thauera linaloolentis]ENO89433.1 TonB-dependent receptor [Thauera linaloolentis 47Lol = DSM 12138]MCM8566930.1 TonB-dependent receptor [Thauera linaloolentis]
MRSTPTRNPRRHRPLLGAATLLSTTIAAIHAPAHAQSTSIGNVQDVVVTTGVRGDQRTVADSPAPIEVINSDQLLRTGRAELGEAISRLLPSFNFSTNQAGVNSPVRAVSNRGLGPSYTLVLVNGKRRHNGSLLANGTGDTSGANPVDLDMIPLSAVSHIEVLKDSAAAQYGSDAVAGVINVVLKNTDHGGHVGLTYGSLYDGDGDIETYKLEGDIGFALGQDGGFLHLSADARQRGMAWWNFPATNGIAYAPGSNPKNATWNRDGAHNGDPEIEAYNLSYNAELPIGGDLTLYSFGTLGQRDTRSGNNLRRPNSLANINQIFPDGYYAINNAEEVDYQFVAGAKGLASGWHWDLSTSYARNRAKQFSELSLNPSLGPDSPTRFDDLATYQFEQWVTNADFTRALDFGTRKPVQLSWGLEHRHERFTTEAGDPLGYLNGGYIFRPGDQPGDPNVGQPAAVGAQAGVALSPADEADVTRRVFAGYADIGFYPTEQWFVDLAVRAEHYSDSTGNTLGGKINSRYDFNPVFAIRGTVGTGFRAPSLPQIGYSQTDNRTNINATGVVVPSLSKLLLNDSSLARALGAEDLDPERSTNIGLGFVLTPSRDVNITVDAYQVEVKDRIARSGYLYGPALAPLLQAHGLTGTEWVNYFANAVDTRSRGVDIVGDVTTDHGKYGVVRWNAAFNWNETEITKIKSSPGQLTGLGANPGGNLVWFGRAAQSSLTVEKPKTKLILSARWLIDAFDVTLQTTRHGAYKWQLSENPAQDSSYGAKWITDLDVTYAFQNGFKVSVGANNLFDVRPDKNGPGDANGGTAFFLYGPSPFAPSGGFYYLKAAYDF